MRNSIVVVADGARARIYAQVRRSDRPGFGLSEIQDLVNPQHKQLDREIYAQARSGLKAEGGTGVQSGMDEHRQDHEVEMERRFAAEVIAAASKHAAERSVRDLILVAGPEMLGLLRTEIRGLDPQITVHEVAKQLTQDTAEQLYERLAGERLLPARDATA